MAFLSSMDISGSGMKAQRMRLDTAAENISNASSTRTQQGGPYRRKMVMFEAVNPNGFNQMFQSAMNSNKPRGGVRVSQIVEDTSPFKSVYNPEHPDADAQGYVMLPNVDTLKETIDAMAATRAYDANITAFNAIKLMASKGLEIGK